MRYLRENYSPENKYDSYDVIQASPEYALSPESQVSEGDALSYQEELKLHDQHTTPHSTSSNESSKHSSSLHGVRSSPKIRVIRGNTFNNYFLNPILDLFLISSFLLYPIMIIS